MLPTEPPARPALPLVDRRTLLRSGLRSGVLGAGLVAVPLTAQFGGQGFTHGVASGEPSQDGFLLWTRFVAGQDTRLTWEVAEDTGFAAPRAGGSALASPEADGCCKVMASGLEPGRWYYYRFIGPDGSVSDVGRSRTLPAGATNRFRMAVFSCSNAGFGWFDVYRHAAEANDFDLVLHLGDYLYEYDPGTYPSPEQRVAGRTEWPPRELVALADYRARFASYRNDPDLRRLHQSYPMICGWDDHESANDSWEGGAENHQPESEGPWAARKAAAIRAYREWMPVSDQPWAQYEIGDLASLFRLETRLTARAEQFSIARILSGQDDPQAALGALTAFRDGAYRDPARELLGQAQQDWLAAGLARSRREGKRWQVLAQQVLMGRLSTAPELAEGLPADLPDYIRRRVLAGALAGRAGLPLNMDAWDGYPAARARVYEAALAAGADLVSLAGDTHNSWAFDLDHAGERVGVEFGGPSVTSPGLETYVSHLPPNRLERATIAQNPQLKWMDGARRGYMAVELTPERATCEFRFTGNVRQRGGGIVATQRVATLAGRRALDIG